MARKSRSTMAGAWPETEAEVQQPVADRELDVRQMAARRRVEQYLESRRLSEHLREIFYEEDR